MLTEYIGVADFFDEIKDIEDERKIYSRVETDIRSSSLQREFKENLKKTQRKCALCDIELESLLIASHIYAVGKFTKNKELSYSEMVQKYVSKDNGLLLCANHDALFDKYLISFDEKGMILINEKLKNIYSLVNISESMKIDVSSTMEENLKYHREISDLKKSL